MHQGVVTDLEVTLISITEGETKAWYIFVDLGRSRREFLKLLAIATSKKYFIGSGEGKFFGTNAVSVQVCALH